MSRLINTYFLILFSFIPISLVLGATVSLVNILIIDISFLILIFFYREFTFIRSKPFLILLLIYLYLIINNLFSIDPELGFFRSFGFVRIIILFLAINFFFKDKIFLKKVLKFWTIFLCLIIFDIFWESYFGLNVIGYGEEYGRRIVSFFKDEPVVGGYLNAFYLIILGFLFSFYDKKNSLKIFLLSLIFFIAIFLTGERSNSIKAFIGIITFYFFLNNFKRSQKTIFFLLTLLIIVILTFNLDFLKHRFVEQPKSFLSTNNIYFKLYNSGFEVFKKYKLLGTGIKNYRVETCEKNEQIKNQDYICSTHPHQIYLELLSEHGIIGFFIFIFLMYKLIFSKINSTFKNRNYLQIGCLIYLIFWFLPLLPSGALFTDFNLTLFTINFSLFYASNSKLNIYNNSTSNSFNQGR